MQTCSGTGSLGLHSLALLCRHIIHGLSRKSKQTKKQNWFLRQNQNWNPESALWSVTSAHLALLFGGQTSSKGHWAPSGQGWGLAASWVKVPAPVVRDKTESGLQSTLAAVFAELIFHSNPGVEFVRDRVSRSGLVARSLGQSVHCVKVLQCGTALRLLGQF